jgi:hypothetical protein
MAVLPLPVVVWSLPPALGRFVEGARGDAGGLGEGTEYIRERSRSGPGVFVRSISYAATKETHKV